jgi:hypothetical protein
VRIESTDLLNISCFILCGTVAGGAGVVGRRDAGSRLNSILKYELQVDINDGQAAVTNHEDWQPAELRQSSKGFDGSAAELSP